MRGVYLRAAPVVDTIVQDIRFVFRSLTRAKTFSAVSLLTMALCTGANTAVFSLLNAVLLRPLPYPEPSRIVTVYNSYPGVDIPKASASGPNYKDRKQATDVFEELALVDDQSFNVGADGSPERVRGLSVTPSLFRVLKAQPRLGRIFVEEEGEDGNDKFVILSEGLWRRLYSGNVAAVGRQLRLNGTLHQIVGVMPADFTLVTASAEWSRDIALWTPLAMTPELIDDERLHSNNFLMIGRLRPEVTIAQAEARVESLNRAAHAREPKFIPLLKDSGFRTVVAPMHEETVAEVRPTLLLLQGGVLFVLLIGCVNVANLLLVRSNSRLKELAVRFAIGSGRWRLTRLLLIESVVLGVLGGVFGLGIAFGGVAAIRALGADQLPRGANIQIDLPVLAFTFGVAVLAGLLFGAAPLGHVLRRNLGDVFRQVSRTGTAERGALMTRGALVVTQVALAFVLLVGAGLLAASFRSVLQQDPGFQAERVLTAKITLPRSRYKNEAQVHRFVRRLQEAVRDVPGVRAAAVNSQLPFAASNNNSVTQMVGYALAPGELPPVPQWSPVGVGYFRVMGIPLLEGRSFELTDSADSSKVAIVDEYLAKRYWPNRSAVGGHVNTSLDPARESSMYSIVGVVGSVRKKDLAGNELPGIVYFPYEQMTSWGPILAVKTELDESALVRPLRSAVLELDPELPLFDVKTMQARLDDSLIERRAILGLSLLFASLALVLSAIGIYGVLAYAVSQRTREIGIRSALGARSSDVIGMISGYGLRLAGIGLLIGAVGSYYLTRLMAALLHGVEPTDPAVFLTVAAVLGVAALLASAVPALRAVRIQPMEALRHE